MEQYIEDKKILGVVLVEDEKTPSKEDIVKVMFEDGSSETMPKRRLELISTDEISDGSSVQEKIKKEVGAVLFGALHEYGIKMGEVDGILDSVTNYANLGYQKARDIKWGGISHEFLPLLEVNKVLIQNAKESNNGTPSTGGESN